MDDREPTADAPRVFISYSDDSAEHAARVLELAQSLRGQGIDAHIDQFEDSPEEGWPRWIYRQMRESDFVLMICTADYLRRCEGEVPRGSGADKAVKFESHLSLQELHDAEGRNRKFVPVLFDDADVGECVPLPMRGATHYRLPRQRDDLYRRLSDQPRVKPVALGALRTLDDDSLASLLNAPCPTVSKDSTAENSVVAPVMLGRSRVGDGQRGRLLMAGAFGVAFLAVALFINASLDGQETVGSDKCSIQLTDPNGGTVDDISAVVLELPAGQTIAVTVQDGKTLTFECPRVAVNARLRVERGGDVSESVHVIESDISISPTPGLQTIELPPPSSPKPEPEPEPERMSEPEPPDLPPVWEPAPAADEGASDDTVPEPSSPRERQPSSPREPSPPTVTAKIDHSGVRAAFQAHQASLHGCYAERLADAPQLGGSLALTVELAATGHITNIKTIDPVFDDRLEVCVREVIAGWTIDSRKIGKGKARLDLEFRPAN